jgi:tetratricopeptide (TPR) repeat protein
MEMGRVRMVQDRRILALGLSLLMSAVIASAQSSGQTVRHRRVVEEDPNVPVELVQAEAAIDKKDLPAAETLLRKVVERDPKNYRAWFDLGFAANAMGRPDESIAAYRKSVEAKPDVFESNLNLGLMLAKTKQPGAEEYLRAATRLKPVDNSQQAKQRAWLALGHAIAESKPDDALEAFRQAASLDPKDPEPHLAAAELYEKSNHFSDAEHEYKQVLAADPNSADALVGIANIYVRGQRLTEARETLENLLQQRPDYVQGRIQLGRVLAADGKNDEAIAQFQAALQQDPNNVAAQRDLADVYTKAGKYTDAEPIYLSLLKASPNDADAHYALGRSYMRQKKFPEAKEQFLTTVKLQPANGDAYGDLAFAASENKEYELAIRALDVRAKLLPDVAITYFLRATAYDHLRAYKEASENYHRFLEVADGKLPDQEWQARHRLIAIEPKKK